MALSQEDLATKLQWQIDQLIKAEHSQEEKRRQIGFDQT
jgi:hypothetical protein